MSWTDITFTLRLGAASALLGYGIGSGELSVAKLIEYALKLLIGL